MNIRNSFQFLMGGVAVLSLAVVSTVPVSAEIAKRSVYRDAATTTVDAGSTEEFAKLYNAKVAVESSAMTELDGSPERLMGSKEFQRRAFSSGEFQRRAFSAAEFQRRAFSSGEFQRAFSAAEFQRRAFASGEFQRAFSAAEFQRRAFSANEFQRRVINQ